MSRHYYMRDPNNGHVWKTEQPEHWKDCERMPHEAGKRAYRAQAIKELRGMIKPGAVVYTNLRNVSASGMSRKISVHVITRETRNDKPAHVLRDVSGYVATALDYRLDDKTGALIVGGCGMDMGFHVVYSLGRTLYRDGKRDAGYSLHHEWV